MKISQIKNSFAMPITSPSYPRTEFKFINREFLIITYETDIDAIRAIVPEPLKVIDPIVKFEFINMPDSYGFGSYVEAGQVIPVELNGKKGNYTHAMYLNDVSPIVAGREIWGFPKKYANPSLTVDTDTLLGRLKYNSVEVAVGTMGYKYEESNKESLKNSLENTPNFLLKIIPNCNGNDLDICQLISFHIKDVTIKGAWCGPAALQLFHHTLSPVADLPVKKIISGIHYVSDLTLGYGTVVHNYLI